MPKSIHERIRAAQMAREKALKALEYKAGEHARRSNAARTSNEIRREKRVQELIDGSREPMTAEDHRILDRLEDM
jgi:hypothetical protein